MGRSRAYWRGNLYPDPKRCPDPDAPAHDLPPIAARQFEALRDGLLSLPGIRERVKYQGEPWRWVWEYSSGSRRVCWLHVMETGLAGTFPIAAADEGELLASVDPGGPVAKAIRTGQRTGPVKWCWLGLEDGRAMDAFVRFARGRIERLAREASVSTVYRHRAG